MNTDQNIIEIAERIKANAIELAVMCDEPFGVDPPKPELSVQQVQQSETRNLPPPDESTSSIAPPPPLSAEWFGLAVGKVMHAFGIMELPVTKSGVEIGRLMLSSGTYMGVTSIVVAWERIEEIEIQQTIYEADGHDLPIRSGVCAHWDSDGLKRLDAYRAEIMESLVKAVAKKKVTPVIPAVNTGEAR